MLHCISVATEEYVQMSPRIDRDGRIPVRVGAQPVVRCPHRPEPGLLLDVICINNWTPLTILVGSENDVLLQNCMGSNVVVVEGLVRPAAPLNGGKCVFDARSSRLIFSPIARKDNKESCNHRHHGGPGLVQTICHKRIFLSTNIA